MAGAALRHRAGQVRKAGEHMGFVEFAVAASIHYKVDTLLLYGSNIANVLDVFASGLKPCKPS